MNNNTLYYTTDFYTITYLPGDDYLSVDWKGFQSKTSVYEGCGKILEYLTELKLLKVLNININAKGLWDHRWVAQNWFPKLLAVGLQKFAWVLSPEALCRNEAQIVAAISPANNIIHTFNDVDSARFWLGSPVSHHLAPLAETDI